MIKLHRILIALCFVALMPQSAFSEVPVVDDSENFTLLEQHQTELESPVTRSDNDLAFNDTQPFDVDVPEQGEPILESEPLAQAEEPLVEPSKPLAFDDESSPNAQDNAMLLDRVQTLQQEVQELRGQLEVQSHDLKMLQQQQLAFYKDLDARISGQGNQVAASSQEAAELEKNLQAKTKARSTSDTGKKLATLSENAKSNPANEQISYLAAYELVKNKKYDDALTATQTFVYQYPQSGYVANAQYWLGELYMVKKQYPAAMEHFDTVINQYPSSSKAAASLLKMGYALAASGQKEQAKQRLEDVVKNYPDTSTAQLAAAKLKALGA
jgi:tol-pal system protein YbgF